MKTFSIQIYGRSRQKFQKLFPNAVFEGYECNIRFAYFKLKISDATLHNICTHEKITILEQIILS
jgi:hypothetical protein